MTWVAQCFSPSSSFLLPPRWLAGWSRFHVKASCICLLLGSLDFPPLWWRGFPLLSQVCSRVDVLFLFCSLICFIHSFSIFLWFFLFFFFRCFFLSFHPFFVFFIFLPSFFYFLSLLPLFFISLFHLLSGVSYNFLNIFPQPYFFRAFFYSIVLFN